MIDRYQLLCSALGYRSYGYSVIPVNRSNKKPLIRWGPYQIRPPSIQEIENWWARWPLANIAVITGPVSNIIVVDVDSDKGMERINALIAESTIKPYCRTPRGGAHFWFKYREGLQTKAGVLEDIDVRAKGGYVIVPPSIGANDVPYRWVLPRDDSEPLPQMPGSLFEALRAPASPSHEIERVMAEFQRDNISIQYTTKRDIDPAKSLPDEAIFHIARHLAQGGMSRDNIFKVLVFILSHCDPLCSEKEAIIKF